MAYRDRSEAGRMLGQAVASLDLEEPVVLGMARGGVPVAFEIARAIDAPLDVLVVRKLGHPLQPELGLGAISEDGVRVLNRELIDRLGVGRSDIEAVSTREELELRRRLALYRGDRPASAVDGRTVVVVDDGLATGSTARAAIEVLRARGARRVVLAVPVGPPGAVEELRRLADEVVCPLVTDRFAGISEWYEDFTQVSDAELSDLLERARGPQARPDGMPTSTGAATSTHAKGEEVEVPAGGRLLPGELSTRDGDIGVVVFAHGSGSSRLSPRNRRVAWTLHGSNLATLLFDLLTPSEAAERTNVFDVTLLGERLLEASRWVKERTNLPLGFFGASTGAAAALIAAAELGPEICAVVSRGGRPDLASGRLASVRAPTLLVVGGDDQVVLALNREARRELTCESELAVIPGATHLFEEPGALEQVAEMASDWFNTHMRR